MEKYTFFKKPNKIEKPSKCNKPELPTRKKKRLNQLYFPPNNLPNICHPQKSKYFISSFLNIKEPG